MMKQNTAQRRLLTGCVSACRPLADYHRPSNTVVKINPLTNHLGVSEREEHIYEFDL